MTAEATPRPAPRRAARPSLMRRLRWLVPYLFLLPGGVWLLVFFAIPMVTMLSVSLQEGSLGAGYALTFNFGIYPEVIERWSTQFLRSIQYGFIVTVLALAIGYPMAYTIAFRGGRYKNILLLLVILPFFTSYLIRTISWKFILADNGFVLGTLKEIGLLDAGFRLLATPVAVISGITYNFLPFVVLPLYVALEKIDPRLIEAATDLYASRLQAFLRVTLPLSLPGVFAGSLLSFIPAVGDFINAELLGSRNTTMIGNVVQRLFLTNNDFPQAAAISFLLMGGILVGIYFYARALGNEELTR
ncbi:MAG TPA: ABC transporter permease [Candidatus Limnocylindrales bacterium]|jgi:spermidine/putrescine transport system permease protein|nr:ABC transporter permease [Candidatus Limnocylindrales bacterium]